jgi:hypothetical protein
MMNDYERTLRKARALIFSKKNWVTGDLAQDDRGVGTLPSSPRASRWCSVGAINRAAWEVSLSEELDMHDMLRLQQKILDSCFSLLGDLVSSAFPATTDDPDEMKSLAITRVVRFNDSAEHSEVIKKFDLAISKAKTLR